MDGTIIRNPVFKYPSTRKIYKNDSIWSGENYLVCKKYGSFEIVIQSDRNPDMAQHSVDILNEHERNNARSENYYWRKRKPGE